MTTYNSRNIAMQELIGLSAEVLNSSDSSQIGIKGKIIKETKNTLILETENGIKRIVKKISTFKFVVGKRGFTVNGEDINFRPHERIEKGLGLYRKSK